MSVRWLYAQYQVWRSFTDPSSQQWAHKGVPGAAALWGCEALSMAGNRCFVCGVTGSTTQPVAVGVKGAALLAAHEKCYCLHQLYTLLTQDKCAT